MIFKANDNEHFNLTLDISTYERNEYEAIINIRVELRNKHNGKVLKNRFSADQYNEAVHIYRRYEEVFFSEREESE